jgi:23S rRNA (guanosine2251-2'-O)-methyltransferase
MTRQVVGLHAARETLKVRPQAVRAVLLAKDFNRVPELNSLAQQAQRLGLKVLVRDEQALRKVATSHQGVCLEVSEDPQFDIDDLSDDPNDIKTLIALDEVSDPHNVGAILRTAWLSGVHGLLVTDRRSAQLTPAVCKVASGGAEHVPLGVAKNWLGDLTTLKEKGFWIFGLAAGAGSKSIFTLNLPPRVVWIVGAEDKGLRTATRKLCDEIVQIPQADPSASLNASVAVGMAMFESARQNFSRSST